MSRQGFACTDYTLQALVSSLHLHVYSKKAYYLILKKLLVICNVWCCGHTIMSGCPQALASVFRTKVEHYLIERRKIYKWTEREKKVTISCSKLRIVGKYILRLTRENLEDNHPLER